jgi:hypothetical protein
MQLDGSVSVRKRYLVVYDYGQGGVWAYITAESPEQITDRFPDLSVVEATPDWMTDEVRKNLEARMSFDIDDPTGWPASFRRKS